MLSGLFRSDERAVIDALKNRTFKTQEERNDLCARLEKLEKVKLADLLMLANSPDTAVRASVGRAILRVSDSSRVAQILEAITTATEIGQRFLRKMIAVFPADEVTAPLSRFFSTQDKRRRRIAVDVLRELPLENFEALMVDALNDPDAEIRLAAIGKLKDSDRSDTRKAVTDLEEDPEERVRVAVVQALSAKPRVDDIELYVRRFATDTFAVQQAAIKPLQELGAQADINLAANLIPLLGDGRARVRNGAIKILLSLPNSKTVVRDFFVYAKQLAGWVRDRALDSFKGFAETIVDTVIELMYDADPEIRSAALYLGSSLEDPRVVDSLCALLADGDWWIRIQAAETLGRIGDPRAIDPLLGLMKDTDARWSAVEALAHINHPRVVESLVPLMRDPAVEVREQVLASLEQQNDKRVLPLLEKFLQIETSLELREQAARALKAISEAHGIAVSDEKMQVYSKGKAGVRDEYLIDKYLVEARDRSASDLHIRAGMKPAIRVFGDLQELNTDALAADQVEKVLLPMLNAEQRRVFDENKQLDLSWTIPNGGRFRVNIFVERKGMGGVFRLIPPKIPTYIEIGLPARCLELTEYHQGLIIVAGPSGCGKSTTLAVLVNMINETKAAHIITLEDPVEYVYPHKSALINQREVPKHTRSFAHALRAALREDPDAIIVGEMRDAETVSLAMTAAETGHLVVGTMHTTSGAKTIDRMLAAFSPAEQQQARMMLSESMKGIIAQRLVPRADGKGQVAMFEVLRHTPALTSLIREGKLLQVPSVMQTGKSHGMQTMDEALLAAVEAGVVAPEDAYLVAEKKETFQDLVPPGFMDSLA